MSTRKPIYDVFLSYAPADVAWAAEVEGKFIDVGLSVYNVAETKRVEDLFDTIWDAMAESSALVALITPGGPKPPTLSFELGAAMGWQKPVYAVWRGVQPPVLPRYVESFGVYPASDIDQVVKLVAKSTHPLSAQEQRVLTDVYQSVGTPVDQLLGTTRKAEELTRQFNRITRSPRSGERLLRELLRLRKQGSLPRLGHQHA